MTNPALTLLTGMGRALRALLDPTHDGEPIGPNEARSHGQAPSCSA